MSGFVFTFCVFPTSFNACYTGLLPEILQAVLECPKLRFYPIKLCADLVDLSSRDQKRQKATPDIFTETHFNDWIQTLDRVYWQHGHAHLLPLLPLMVFLLMMISLQDSQPTGSGNWTTCRNILINIYILAKFYKYNFS